MKDEKDNNGGGQLPLGTDHTGSIGAEGRRSYSAPRVSSVERLEATAAVCDPPSVAFGKTTAGFSCASLGS